MSNILPARSDPHRQGVNETGGSPLSTSQALKLCADARVIPVVFGTAKDIVAYGNTHRIFTENQRLAMIARDLGCTFPACDTPPLWCEAHHAPEHTVSGHTTVTEGTLACGFHHREHKKLGWDTILINSIPHWRPPAWIDPERRPIRNWMHHPLPDHDLGS